MDTKRTVLFFNLLGIAPNLKGYPCLVYLVSLAAASDCWDVPKLQDLYTKTAKFFGVSPGQVSGNIRTVLEKYLDQGNVSTFYEITGYKGGGSLSVKEFVCIAADYLAGRQA